MKKLRLARLILCLSLFLGLSLGSNIVQASVLESKADAKDRLEQALGTGSGNGDTDGTGSGNGDTDGTGAGTTGTVTESEEHSTYDEQLQDAKNTYDKKNIANMTADVKPAANNATELITHPIMVVFNTIIYVVLTIINTYFFVQTCFDIAFLIAPGFRNWLSGNQNADSKSGKTARFVNGMVSEAALNSVGYVRTKDDKKHINSEDMASEVDWKSWLIKRVGMFICIMAYLALLMMDLLSDFVAIFTRIGYSIVKAVFDMIDGDESTIITYFKIWF